MNPSRYSTGNRSTGSVATNPVGALCVDNKNVQSSTSVEVEAHVSVTTDVILEDLTVFGDCHLTSGGDDVAGGRFGPSRRPAYAWDPKTQKKISH